MTAIAMELKDVEKSFGSVIALSHVSVKVREGAVTCILGDNGAGKSTLIKTLSGVHKPTSGVYEVQGEPVSFDSPRDALAKGIATVYQDLATIPLMSVWRNFFLGNEITKGWGPFRRLDVKKMKELAKQNCWRWVLIFATPGSRSEPSPVESAKRLLSLARSTSVPRCSSSMSPPPLWVFASRESC
jgi:ABC-type sugar transport system ATPase subunit